MDSKPWYLSKTLWTNIVWISFEALYAGLMIVKAEPLDGNLLIVTNIALAMINIVLRYRTTKAIE